MENNILKYNYKDSWTSIQGRYQCFPPPKMFELWKKVMNIWKIQLNKFVLDVFKNYSPFRSLKLLLSLNKCFAKKYLFMFLRKFLMFCIEFLVNLIFDQHFSLFHNLSTLTICNKVEMHTKVNHCSQNGLESMENIINLTL
jgi:hypothetical protein